MNRTKVSPPIGSGDAAAAAASSAMGRDDLVALFSRALLARRFEERLVKLTIEGFLPPLLHPGAGQEVAQLAALHALNPDDPLLYAHRGTAYLLGRDVSLAAIIADMAGRDGGTNNGKGGVMHVVDVGKGVYGESGTIGGGFVIATGMGMALKKQRRSQVVVHFFGDGASNRGTFHESLNWSALQRLPIIFICENNGWAVSVPTKVSTSVADIAVRATGYGIPGVIVDGADPDAVHEAVAAAAVRARSGDGPSLIEVKCTRLMGHYATDPQDYRADIADEKQRDPLAALRARLTVAGWLDDDSVQAIEDAAQSHIEAAVETAMSAPVLDGDAAFMDLYA